MPEYRRPRLPGATVFFTVALAERGSRLLVERVDLLREAVRVTKGERPFGVAAWVVLPDHLHAVWVMPDGDADYSVRWGAIKARFTRAVKAEDRRVAFHPTAPGSPAMVGWNPTRRSPSKIAKGDAGLWQRRFWERHVRDEDELAAVVRYCWINPVKHGLVERPEKWPWSSFHRDGRPPVAGWIGP